LQIKTRNHAYYLASLNVDGWQRQAVLKCLDINTVCDGGHFFSRHAGIDRDRFLEYFDGCEFGYAIAIGGVAKKSRFVMQTVADVLNMEVTVPAEELLWRLTRIPGLGAAKAGFFGQLLLRPPQLGSMGGDAAAETLLFARFFLQLPTYLADGASRAG
jgi:hypothetical protein